jgi:hypothetical protein
MRRYCHLPSIVLSCAIRINRPCFVRGICGDKPMRETLFLMRCACVMLCLAGCGDAPTPGGSGSGGTPVGTTGGTTSGAGITQPSVYVVSDSISPVSVLVFPQTASGPTSASLEIPGSQVSVDSAGNVYVLSASLSSINVYSAASPTGPPIRSLPVGPGTKIAAVADMVTSATGEIFVSDGKGIAVFSPAATGDDDPVRYIMGNTQPGGGSATAITPGLIAVDSSDNLYVTDTTDSSIVVFGPTDNGTVVPARTIAGPLTHLAGTYAYLPAVATDSSGNLFALCICSRTDGSGFVDFGVFEFGPSADGNVAPIRFVTSPEMYPYTGGNGIAVNSAGTIYVSSGTPSGTQTVFEFANTASGSVAATNTVTIPGWADSPPSRIAVH